VVGRGRTSIRHACQTFALSETAYRYQAMASEENAQIADWLARLSAATIKRNLAQRVRRRLTHAVCGIQVRRRPY
jgi:hypothetical protein